jgi:ATP-dependent Clp protease, protease subunit
MPDNPSLLNLYSAPSGVFYINYFDTINDAKVRGLMALCTEIISKYNPAQLYFAFSSAGGNVAAGITLYHYLMALPLEVTMHNIGSVDSIAAVVFMAGAKRYACSHTCFLFHGISQTLSTGQGFTITQMHELLSGLEQGEAGVKGILTERSRLTGGDLDAFFRQGATKDPAFALQRGVIDDIREFRIPKAAQVVTFQA